MKKLAEVLFRILRRIAERRPPDFVIGQPGDDYMRRWHVWKRNPALNVYLHHFLRSDDDRALHDHPWWNVSFLLHGSYIEHTIAPGGVNRRTQYQAGDLKFRRAKAAHRVELNAGECWSLFLTGPRIRDWGFHCPAGWVPWQKFTSPDEKGRIGKGCDQ